MAHKWRFPNIYLKGKFREQATDKQLDFIYSLKGESEYSLKDILASIPGWQGTTIQGLITKGEAAFIIGCLKGDIKPQLERTDEQQKTLDAAREIMLEGLRRAKTLRMEDIRSVD